VPIDHPALTNRAHVRVLPPLVWSRVVVVRGGRRGGQFVVVVVVTTASAVVAEERHEREHVGSVVLLDSRCTIGTARAVVRPSLRPGWSG
jgi:hypothetical protein